MDGKDEDGKIEINIIRGCHITNIGNAFLDIGSEMAIRLAVPDARINRSSSFPSWFSDQSWGTLLWGKTKLTDSFYFVADKIPCSFAVFSGMVVTARFVRRYAPIIDRLRQRDIRIILNGAGPSEYSKSERATVAKFWNERGLYALVSRDQHTFETYADVPEHIYDGIDCGFFVNDAVKPVDMESNGFNVLNFDSMSEPDELRSMRNVVRTHHRLYPNLGKTSIRDMRRPNSFVSEQPEDYLNIYGNANQVYSDRVHACVASASFDKPFRLYTDSKRALLFEKVGLDPTDLGNGLVTVDRSRLQGLKDAQVQFLRAILRTDMD